MVRVLFILHFILLSYSGFSQKTFEFRYSVDLTLADFTKKVLDDSQLFLVLDSTEIELIKVNDSIYSYSLDSENIIKNTDYVWVRMIMKNKCYLFEFPNIFKFEGKMILHITITKMYKTFLGFKYTPISKKNLYIAIGFRAPLLAKKLIKCKLMDSPPPINVVRSR